MSEKVGTWPQVCVQRAFVEGASWWIWANGSTPFPAERDLMETEAVRRYGEPASDLIAAAEERGRRRAETERDELRALLGKLVAWADLPATKAVTMSAWIHDVKYRAEDVAVWDEARAALAPRDSAPVCDAVLSSDPFREWRCGKPKDHEGPHSGEAPRDSGKGAK